MKQDAHLFRVPDVAWPTLLLTACTLLAWAGSGVALYLGWLPWPLSLAISTIAAFVSFTPLHDATHRAVGRHSALNAVVGRLCALPLLAPYPAFRHLHLSHHRNTNDPEADPDFWSGEGPGWQLPLRWLSQDAHYYTRYLPDASRPKAEKAESIVTMVVLWASVLALLTTPLALTVLLAWVLPGRLAIALLAFTFDYLPHRPHTITGREDRHRATVNFREPWLGVLMLNQNHHLAHHLYPSVPFYRYHLAWRAKQASVEAKGGRTVGLTDLAWWRDPLSSAGPESFAGTPAPH